MCGVFCKLIRQRGQVYFLEYKRRLLLFKSRCTHKSHCARLPLPTPSLRKPGLLGTARKMVGR